MYFFTASRTIPAPQTFLALAREQATSQSLGGMFTLMGVPLCRSWGEGLAVRGIGTILHQLGTKSNCLP